MSGRGRGVERLGLRVGVGSKRDNEVSHVDERVLYDEFPLGEGVGSGEDVLDGVG